MFTGPSVARTVAKPQPEGTQLTDGRLLLLERLLTDAQPENGVPWVDLNMLVLVSRLERTEADFRSLCAAAGFELTPVIPVGGLNHIEATQTATTPQPIRLTAT